jgi:membrane-associated phospholipid phosphatase
MSEALAQSTDMVGYWAGLLMFSRFSHPWTFRLARIAIVVGEFMAMHLKRQQGRPRPSQLSPALMPPIPVPGHASYPSGHATQAYLLSGLMARVMPAFVNAPLGLAIPPAPATNPLVNPAATVLDRLAERVARNREVMGLHYRSDSTAGQGVAALILPKLLACPTMAAAAPNGVIAMAQLEWL